MKTIFFTGHSPCWDSLANMEVKSAGIRLMVNRTWSAPFVGRVRRSVDGGVLRGLTPGKRQRFVNFDETSDLNPFWVETMTKCHYRFIITTFRLIFLKVQSYEPPTLDVRPTYG